MAKFEQSQQAALVDDDDDDNLIDMDEDMAVERILTVVEGQKKAQSARQRYDQLMEDRRLQQLIYDELS
ncbi:MAG: hypothetical protein OEZ58_01740 [Gammaproteobacteria bacterium]|nr:hypothetical protein [Gammaproteobacteria bacterium]MDH5727683.1 hypothetical protein [Gammaproteobacteria bacterium]